MSFLAVRQLLGSHQADVELSYICKICHLCAAYETERFFSLFYLHTCSTLRKLVALTAVKATSILILFYVCDVNMHKRRGRKKIGCLAQIEQSIHETLSHMFLSLDYRIR
jgi:hypothetical protein